MSDNYVHGSLQHAVQSMEMQTETDQTAVSVEQGYDTEPIHPVEVSGAVAIAAPCLGFPQCVFLTANTPVALLLPHDPKRRNALVLAVDNDVYLCPTKEAGQAVSGAATGIAGFYLPKGILMVVPSLGAVWAACTTTGSTSRVSVFVTRDE